MSLPRSLGIVVCFNSRLGFGGPLSLKRNRFLKLSSLDDFKLQISWTDIVLVFQNTANNKQIFFYDHDSMLYVKFPEIESS
jgi:hypothetical protein